jgi:hypothetical protein
VYVFFNVCASCYQPDELQVFLLKFETPLIDTYVGNSPQWRMQDFLIFNLNHFPRWGHHQILIYTYWSQIMEACKNSGDLGLAKFDFPSTEPARAVLTQSTEEMISVSV